MKSGQSPGAQGPAQPEQPVPKKGARGVQNHVVDIGAPADKKLDEFDGAGGEAPQQQGLPPPPPPPRMGNPANGAALYERCVSCHGLNAKNLAGQTEADLMAEMQNYQMNTYTNPRIVKMQQILNGMTQEQLLDIAAYISAQ